MQGSSLLSAPVAVGSGDMDDAAFKKDLHRYLYDARAALLWKLEGLSEYDVRRPLTPHGTNLLGLIKHLTGCEIGYFGAVFDRPFAHPPQWLAEPDDPTVDMWAAAEETRQDILDLYRRACEHADTTIVGLDLDQQGIVASWPEHRRTVTLHGILVHMIAETTRHAGHADIVRELIDNHTGLHPDRLGLPDADPDYWVELHQRIANTAHEADAATPKPAVTLRAMTDTEYVAATAIREAEARRELTKQMPANLANERVRRATAELLPNGRKTLGHHVVVAIDAANSVVGHAWMGPDPRSATGSTECAWLHDLYIHAPFRRRGYGIAVLIALEQLVIRLGLRYIALNVAADNTAACALYQRAGYTTTSQYLRKDLSSLTN